jgi:CheY-like chemotaxis protein/Flp pilus assembly protein TadD
MISVLLVEDDPAVLELTRIFLERTGSMQVETSRNVPEAIGILKTRSFDVIVSDYMMPQIDGLVFLKMLRMQGDRVPFIMFTGKGREAVAMEALNNGADFYLTKENDPQRRFSELVKMIEMAVQRREAENSMKFTMESVDLIDLLPDATFAIDSFGRVIAWNKAMETLTGVRALDILHKGNKEYSLALFGERKPILIDCVLKNDDVVLNKQYPQVKKEGEAYTAEIGHAKLKGKEAYLWVKIRRIYDREGKLLAAIESVHDVTDVRHSRLQQLQDLSEKPAGFMDRIFGKDKMTGFQKGYALQQQGRFEDSLFCFDHAIEREKDNARAWKGKGISLKELGRYEEALQCFDQAIFLDQKDPDCYYYQGELREKIGRSNGDFTFIEQAIPSFERAIELEPDNWKAWNYIGLCNKELGKNDEAKHCFDRAEMLLHRSRGLDTVPKISNVAAARKKPASNGKK